MPENPKKKQAIIGEDGEFLEEFPVEEFPVKEKRKQAPRTPFIISRASSLIVGVLAVIVLGLTGIIIFLTIPSGNRLDSQLTIVPTEEAFAVQVTSPLSSCEQVYAFDGDKISLIANKDGKRGLHIYALDYGIWCTLDMPILQHMAWNPDGSQLAFTAVSPGNRTLQLFVINADGSNLRQLTNDVDGVAFPQWHGFGHVIAYQQFHGDITSVHLINSDGSDDKIVFQTDIPFAYEAFRWGGEQKLLLSYTAVDLENDAINSDIYIHNLVDMTVTRATTNSGYDGYATWLDDDSIIYMSVRDSKMGIYRTFLGQDDKMAMQLTPDDHNVTHYNVSPNQQWLNYQIDTPRQLFIVSTRGDDLRLLLDSSQNIWNPQWSPDSQQIAYIVENEDEVTNDLVILDVISGEQKMIKFSESIGYLQGFAWRPSQ